MEIALAQRICDRQPERQNDRNWQAWGCDAEAKIMERQGFICGRVLNPAKMVLVPFDEGLTIREIS